MTSDDSLPAFLTTATDSSLVLRMTFNVSLIITPCRLVSFRAGVRMLYEKAGKRNDDTAGTDPSRSFRMTFNVPLIIAADSLLCLG